MRREALYKKVHNYLEKIIPDRPPVLREMEEYARENEFPIIGPLVGRYLFQMVITTKARKILEMGSGFGYSAFWFSLATRGKGHITMIDSDKRNKKIAFDFFKKAGLLSQFDFKVGDAIKMTKKLDGPFDIVLNDIDKVLYPQTIDLVAGRLRRGGLFITDNLIWSGKVYEKEPDEVTRAIIDFTKSLYADSRFYTTVLPIRDGVSVSVRL